MKSTRQNMQYVVSRRSVVKAGAAVAAVGAAAGSLSSTVAPSTPAASPASGAVPIHVMS